MTRIQSITILGLALACVASCTGDEVPAAGSSESESSGSSGEEDGSEGHADGFDTDIPEGCGDGVVSPSELCDDGNDDNTDACLNNCVTAQCGDGFVWEDMEDCDDGNLVDGDGCTKECTPPACGDHVVQDGEECDDGNENDNDACLSSCLTAICGDGFVQANVEACDDGNDIDDDMCTNACTWSTCGDGMVQGGEECDDGNSSYLDDCLPTCVLASCGDSYPNGDEECDDGDSDDNDECRNNCEDAVCGDGVVQAGVEACDDGNTNNGDQCTNSCALPSCGNGVVEGSEACDDGDSDDSDACLSTCVAASCGDGHLHAGVEECDDSNGDNSDGCLSTCVVARSCKVIHQEVPSASSGIYSIDPDGPNGPGTPREVRCDMSTDGGGWTLVASSRNTPPQDQVIPYHSDLRTINPANEHNGVWDGMRPLATGDSDIRFTCMLNPNSSSYTVDLSFYDIHWYEEITTGTDAQSCFSENNGWGDDQPEPARRNNRTGQQLPVNNAWNWGYLEGEDYCSDSYDFGVDFDNRGMDSHQDGTDWGLDDGRRWCWLYNVGTGAWHIWVREA